MNEAPLLSIIIPTKDRYKYIKILISLIDSYNLRELELIIQDNTFNNTEILQFLELKNRTYLKYFHTIEQIPISKNVDLAIQNSNGEYICFIGDDDGVLPNIISCVNWMKVNSIEALRSGIVVYNWPDFIGFNKNSINGELIIDDFSNEIIEINCLKALKQLANRGFKNLNSIPKLYQGIVKRSCLDEIYKIGKTYTPGPSPDMATAVALSFVVKKFVITNIPVIIIGQCITVGGGESLLNGAVKKIEDVPFLPNDAKEQWNNRIPKVWCSQTIWPESATKAIQYMKKEKEIKINYEYILCWFIQTHPLERKIAKGLSKNKLLLYIYLIYYSFFVPIVYGAKSVLNVFRFNNKTLKNYNSVCNISDIEQASNYIVQKFSNIMIFDENNFTNY